MAIVIYAMLALLGGVAITVQVGANVHLDKAANSAVFSAATSFVVGALVLCALFVALRHPWPSASMLKSAPTWAWAAGCFGASYVLIATLAAPVLGGATLLALVVAGQIGMALVADHYGLLGFPVRALNPWRVLGAGLLIAGVIVIQRH